MATSPTSICNSGLRKIGAARIIGLSDTSKNGMLCNEAYDELRKELLSSHPWNFASKRSASLAEVATQPKWGFDHAYQLPNDCLRVFKTNLLFDEDYKIEDDKLLTNSNSVQILYAVDLEDAGKFRPYFVNAFAWRIAAELAYAITQSASVAAECGNQFKGAMSLARSMDAQEGRPDAFNASTWLNARY